MIPETKPDAEEKVIRFVCGAAMGAAITFFSLGASLGPVGIGAGLGGLLAMVFGDRFWRVLLRLFPWW